MNNDIPRDMNSYINVPKKSNAPLGGDSDMQNEETNLQDSEQVAIDLDMGNSMNCVLGKLQVNPKKSADKNAAFTKESVEHFMQNPEFAQSHVELCDELVKRGYSLEDAIKKTDMFFDALKNAGTYQ